MVRVRRAGELFDRAVHHVLQLRVVTEPPGAIADAVASAMASKPTAKRWRLARDATHPVVELDLGIRHWRIRRTLSGDYEAIDVQSADANIQQ